MKRFNRYIHLNSRGTVTIFLIILMLPSFLFGGYCVDLARLEAAKTMISSAGDLVLTSALTQYNQDLYNRYGLLATEVNGNNSEILSDYYDSMIESSPIIPVTSSSTSNLINNIQSYLPNLKNNKFNNFVKMSSNPAGFSIRGAANTQITNPDILRSQIIEYMKYRGPISLASGLLTKIKTIGDIDQQAKTVEKKTDYEDKLGDIGDACLEAYKKINTYNKSEPNQKINEILIQIKSRGEMNEISEILSYYKKQDNKVKKWNKSKLSNSPTLNSLSQDQLYEYIRDYIDDPSILSESERIEPGTYKGIRRNGNELKNLKTILENYKDKNGIEKVTLIYAAIGKLNDKYVDYNKLYWYCQQYISNYGKQSETTDEEDKEYNRVKVFDNNFSKSNSIIYTYQETDINNYVPIAQEILNAKKAKIIAAKSKATDLKDMLGDIVKKLNNILDEVKEAESAKEQFKSSINSLATSEFKNNMQAQYNTSASKLSEKNLNDLVKKVKEYTKYVEDVLKSINDGGTFYKNNIGKTINLANIASSIGKDTSTKTISSNYIEFNTSVFRGTVPVQINESEKFYAYLKTICAGSDKGSSNPDDEKAISNGLQMAENISLDEKKVPSGTIDAGGSDTNQGVSTYKGGSYDRKKSTSSILSYFGNISQTLTSITNLKNIFDGDTSRDALYTMEYMAQMFTCYTDIEEKGLKNLNGIPLEQSTCQFYGGEMEYLLGGNKNPQDNINAAQGQIFTMRFVMNLMYAMSDSSITNTAQITATSLAAGLPFLIPVIKTVIVCAVAIAETSLDLQKLLKGKDVAFVKSNKTFVYSPSGLAEGLTDLMNDQVKNTVSDGIKKVTEHVIEKVNGGIGTVKAILDEYIDDVSQNIISQISSVVNTTIFGTSTKLLTDIGNNVNLTETYVKRCLQKGLGDIRKAPSSSKLIQSIKEEFVDYILTKELDYFVSSIIAEKSNVLTNLELSLENIQRNINNRIDILIKNNFTKKVKTKILAASSELTSEIEDASSSYSEELKSLTTEKINEAFNNFNTTINGRSGDGNSKQGTSAGGAGFTLNYKEYLQLFLLMQLMDSGESDSSQRRNIIRRSADLIDINLGMNNGNTNLNDLYTILTMESSVDVGTSFINISFDKDGKGKVDFDLENIRKSKYTYKYNSAKGY